MAVRTPDAGAGDDVDIETLPLDERTIRAAGEAMVTHEHAPGLYTVYSEDGTAYQVEPNLGACTCGDARYRDERCKHQRRALLATGQAELPEAGNYHVDTVLAKRLEVGGLDV